MKILGITLGKEKAVSFNEFRDIVRLAVRRENPGARLEPRDDGFILYREGEAPIVCNIKQLYGNYYKAPANRDALIGQWIGSLTFETPKHTWTEAAMTLRPTLKNKTFIDAANRSLAKQDDSLPCQHFLGELHVIVMRDLPGTAVAVTQIMLTEWGVTLEECMAEAMGNMGVLSFPDVANALMTGSGKKGMPQEEVGLVFKGDHLTATWLISDRFRDYVGQRLQGDYVVIVPSRAEMTAVRADEPGLIASIQQAARSYASRPYPLSGQLYHVSAAMTGGAVTIYQPGAGGTGDALDPNSQFAKSQPGTPASALPSIANMAAETPQQVKSLNDWFGLSESTMDEPAPIATPPNVKTARKNDRPGAELFKYHPMIHDILHKLVDGQDLTRDEAAAIMTLLMAGQAAPSQVGALLIALRMKGETVEEVSAFAQVMRTHVVPVQTQRKPLLDTCGTGGSRFRVFNVSTAAAFVMAAAGVAVAKHGNRAMSGVCGSADVLEALGVRVNLTPEQCVRCIEEVGIGFLFAQSHHPSMKHVGATRREIGVRSVFNLLGPLTNPAGATRQTLGVYDRRLCALAIGALRDLGSERAIVMHGDIGLDEISTLGATHISELRDGHIENYVLMPHDLGLCAREPRPEDLAPRPTPEANAHLLRDVLGGAQSDRAEQARQDLVAVNAAASLRVCGIAESWPDAVEMARAILRSGRALQTLDALSALTQTF